MLGIGLLAMSSLMIIITGKGTKDELEVSMKSREKLLKICKMCPLVSASKTLVFPPQKEIKG